MIVKVGLVGLPNVGKSTFFNALTHSHASAENYAFCTINPNIAIMEVEDKRLKQLIAVDNPKNIVKDKIEIIDIAGLVEGASTGEGLGNQFLANIREVDIIIHIIRCFENINIEYQNKNFNPIKNKEIIDCELQLKDIESITNRIDKIKKNIKNIDNNATEELATLTRFQEYLSSSRNIRSLSLNDEEIKIARNLQLLTYKPVIYICNINDFNNIPKSVVEFTDYIKSENEDIFLLPIKNGQDIEELTTEEIELFYNEYTIWKNNIEKLIFSIYKKLKIITFFTSGSDETRAWHIQEGTIASKAAGSIHTDFEKNFIKAEIINIDDYCKAKKNNEKVNIRVEGKEYIMQDGDVVIFKIGQNKQK